jgi:ketosteroid isomerase-like protein
MPESGAHSDEVLAVVRREAAAMRDGSIDDFMALLTADAVLLPPDLLPKTGAELRGWLGAFLDRFGIEWLSLVDDETVVDGTLAYHVYSYTWRATPRDGGAPREASGKGLHILRRGEDGRWRIAREIWNPNPAA